MISYIALCLAVVALLGVTYISVFVLPKMGSGMKELGNGLSELGKRVQDFMANKL